MPGGKRPGAGRKSGDAWKGASPRDPAVRSLARARVKQVLSEAQDPLSVLTEIAANATLEPQLRVQAATAACPFIYPRLSAAVVATTNAAPTPHDHAVLVDRILNRIASKAPNPAPILEHESPVAVAT